MVGGEGDDIFIFSDGFGSDTVDGGAGWADAIQLDASIDSAVDPANPWQIEVDGQEVAYDLGAGSLDFGTDTSGVLDRGNATDGIILSAGTTFDTIGGKR